MAKKQILGVTIFFPVLFFFIISAQTVDSPLIFRSFFSDNAITLLCSGLTDNQLEKLDKAEIFVDQTKLENVSFLSVGNSNIPINTIFLIDVSKTVFKSDRELPAELINQFLDDPIFTDRGRFGIISFDDSIHLVLSPTNNHTEIIAAAHGLTFESSSSNFSQAILDSLGLFEKSSTSSVEKDQIILITDGAGYNDEKINEKEIAEKLRSTGISLSVLVTRNTNSGSYDKYDFNRLGRLASDSGGAAVSTESINSALKYKEIMIAPIRRSCIITGVIPSEYIPDHKDIVLVSLSLFNKDQKIAEVNKTVLPPSPFFADLVQVKTQSAAVASSTRVPINSTSSKSVEGSSASLVPIFTNIPGNSSGKSSIIITELSIKTDVTPTYQSLINEEKTSTSTPHPTLAIEPTSTVTRVPVNPTSTLTKPPLPTFTRIPSSTAVVTPTPKSTETNTAVPIVSVIKKTPSKDASTSTTIDIDTIEPVATLIEDTPSKNRSESLSIFTFTLKDLGYTSDVEYQGVLANHQYDINLPGNWDFSKPAVITIYFSHSLSLNPRSSLAVDWNDTRVASSLLDSTNADHGSLQVEIPANQMSSGYNKLSLQFYMGIRDDFCEDFDNPAVWAVVHDTTSLDVQYSARKPNLDLNILPDYLVDPSPLCQNTVTLVLPDAPTTAELNAAALVSTKLGQMADWHPLELKMLALEQLALQKPTGNLIIIANAQYLSTQNETLIPNYNGSAGTLQLKDLDGENIDADAGVLWLQTSPYDSQAFAVTLTGSTSGGLEKAARAFATTSVYDRLSGQMGIILDTLPSGNTTNISKSLIYTLSGLGYQDIVAAGNRQQSTNLNVPLQMVFNSLGDATFKLNFSHSTVLNPERSYMDVLINNVPVKRINLNSSNAENSEEEINIPLRLFKLGNNVLTITSNIQVDASVAQSTLYCTDEYYSESWLTISPDSSLIFPSGVAQNTTSLMGYPGINLGQSSLSNLAFVVPDTIDWASASTVLTVANRIGRIAKGDQLFPAVITASTQEKDAVDRPYQIFVGLFNQNPAIAQINDLLPLPFEEDGITPKALEGVTSISLPTNSLGFIESLFTAEGTYRLVLTANSPLGLEWVATAMDTPAVYQNFIGNLVVLSGKEETSSFTIPAEASLVSNQSFVTTQSGEKELNQHPNWVVLLTAGIFIISVSGLLVNWFIKKR